MLEHNSNHRNSVEVSRMNIAEKGHKIMIKSTKGNSLQMKSHVENTALTAE